MAPDEPSAPRRRRSSPPASTVSYASQSTPSLAELIAHERTELMQIHAMVRCLNDVLLYADDDDSPMHADVADVVARLLDDSIVRLEGVHTRVAQLEASAEQSSADAPPPNQVREPRLTYLC